MYLKKYDTKIIENALEDIYKFLGISDHTFYFR